MRDTKRQRRPRAELSFSHALCCETMAARFLDASLQELITSFLGRGFPNGEIPRSRARPPLNLKSLRTRRLGDDELWLVFLLVHLMF